MAMKIAIMKALIFTPTEDGGWGLPAVFTGDPGYAKTAMTALVTKMFALYLEEFRVAERGESALGVTPMGRELKDGRQVIGYPSPDWCLNFLLPDGTEEGVLLFDELTTAPPSIQPALLGGIQKKTIGSHTFGPRVRVMACTNPPETGATIWPLPESVANRLGHFHWPAPTAEEWTAWLLGGDQEVEVKSAREEEERVMSEWPEAFAKASGLVAAFILRRPELLAKLPPIGDPARNGAYPSPRSWSYAVRALASSYVHGLTDVESDEMVSAFIGASAAGEFFSWQASQDLPDPAQLLDGAVKWKHDARRLDRTQAVLSACVALVTPATAHDRLPRAKVLWSLLSEVMKDAKDVCVPAMTALVRAKLSTIPEARPVMAKLMGVFDAAKGA